jgi:hypothetical protein
MYLERPCLNVRSGAWPFCSSLTLHTKFYDILEIFVASQMNANVIGRGTNNFPFVSLSVKHIKKFLT